MIMIIYLKCMELLFTLAITTNWYTAIIFEQQAMLIVA